MARTRNPYPADFRDRIVALVSKMNIYGKRGEWHQAEDVKFWPRLDIAKLAIMVISLLS